MLAELERLRRIMEGTDYEEDKDYKNLSNEEKVTFDKFLESYSKCPMCNIPNHKNYLLKFFLDPTPDKIRLKERLLKLMKESRHLKNLQKANVSILLKF